MKGAMSTVLAHSRLLQRHLDAVMQAEQDWGTVQSHSSFVHVVCYVH